MKKRGQGREIQEVHFAAPVREQQTEHLIDVRFRFALGLWPLDDDAGIDDVAGHGRPSSRALRISSALTACLPRRRAKIRSMACARRPRFFPLNGLQHQLGNDRALVAVGESLVEQLLYIGRYAEVDGRQGDGESTLCQ